MSENEKKERETYYNSKPRLGGNGPSKIRQQFNRGMTYFLVIAASLAFYFALLRFRHIFNVLWKVYDVLKPIIYGAVVAYLLNPIVKRVDKRLIPVLEKKVTKPGRAQNISRSVGVFTSLIVLLVLISALCNLLIPELYVSIRDMIYTLPEHHMVKLLRQRIVSELSIIEVSGLQQGLDAAVAAVLRETFIIADRTSDLPRLEIAAEGGTRRHADHAIEADALLHKHIEHTRGEHPAHRATLTHQALPDRFFFFHPSASTFPSVTVLSYFETESSCLICPSRPLTS